MKKNKKILAAIIALSLTAGVGVGTAVAIHANAQSEKAAQAVLEGDLIMDNAATVTLGATQTIRARVGDEVVRCTWESSDASVLTVEGNGNVIGHQLGKATVTARYEDKEAKCEVTVALNDNLPSFEFDAVDGDEVQIDMGHPLSLGGKIRFNGNTYDDAEITYTLSGDKSLGSIENGVFTPVKEGTATITATASWRGVSSDFLTKKLQVTVVPSVVLLLNDSPVLSDVNVYTVDNWQGRSYKNTQEFNPVLLINGERVTPSVTVSHTDVAEYDEATGAIIGNMHGQTTAVISYSSDTVEYTKTIPVIVSAPLGVWEAKVEYFSSLKGELIDVNGKDILSEAFGGDNGMLLAYQGEKALDISTGKILGVETSLKGLTETRLTIYGKKYAYSINVSGYTMVIENQEDVVAALTFDRNGSSVRQGYYYLKNDVDMTDYDVNGDGQTGDALASDSINTASSYGEGERNPFRGIFDGNGKTIKGLKVGGGCGLFGVLDRATVKDLALTELNAYGSFSCLFGFTALYSTIENVYISFDFNNGSTALQGLVANNPSLWLGKTKNFGLFGHRPATNATNSVILNNVIIEMSHGFTETAIDGTVGMFCNDPFTPNGGTTQPAFSGVYFLVPTASNGRIMPMCQADKDYSGKRIRQTVYAENVFTELKNGTKISFDEKKNPVADEEGLHYIYHYVGTSHYENVGAMKAAGVTAVGKWTVNESNQLVFVK